MEKIKLLLDVADQIEKSAFYSGASWWHNYEEEDAAIPVEEKGCAMTRILLQHGATIHLEERAAAILKLDEEIVYPFYFENHIKEVTGINADFWEKFRSWSIHATKESTVTALRMLGNKEFDFYKTINGNLGIDDPEDMAF